VIDSSHSVSNTASQVAQGSGALSQRTQEQAATLEETAGSMEEMTSTVQQNTDAAQLANQLATEVRNEAENSSTVVHKAIEAMEKITDSSQKIAEIITLIDGIAFQTNLLALNAAVEAARAGEHGRGFAVVANEVRSLAQKSAEASKEVKELIEGSVSRVKEGGRHVSATGTALEKMNQSIKKVSDLISEIAVASTEQQTGINQVSSSIAGMDRVTQENAAAVEETNAAADQMANLARHMRQLMAFFNTSERLY
jgi:methyl-accepting chemotaxis protein